MRILALTLSLLTAAAAHAGEIAAETEHLRWLWNDDAMEAGSREIVQTRGEATYRKVVEQLGVSREERTVVLMHGPAARPDGGWGIPHVDSVGRVHLYRFGPTHHDYLSAFAHELVHSFRADRLPHHDWFFEEGFAELVALRVNDSTRGFPWYGFPVDVVAGQWVAADLDLPMPMLRERHRELNLPCKLQVYALRGSFFDDLGRRFGDAALLEMASRERAGAREDYREALGGDLESLAREWRERLLSRWAAIEDAAAQAERYRTESPAKYQAMCAPDGTRLEPETARQEPEAEQAEPATVAGDGTKIEYRWYGTAPFCSSSPSDCREDEGWYFWLTNAWGTGRLCFAGSKSLCVNVKKSEYCDVHWIGNGPDCSLSGFTCVNGGGVVIATATGYEGLGCTTGRSTLCAKRCRTPPAAAGSD
jgi:hypothetical protein